MYQSVPITLLPNPTIQSGGPFTWDNLFYPNSYAFGAGSGTNSQNDPNAYGAEFWVTKQLRTQRCALPVSAYARSRHAPCTVSVRQLRRRVPGQQAAPDVTDVAAALS